MADHRAIVSVTACGGRHARAKRGQPYFICLRAGAPEPLCDGCSLRLRFDRGGRCPWGKFVTLTVKEML